MHGFGSGFCVDDSGRGLPMGRIRKKRSKRMFLARPLFHSSGEAFDLGKVREQWTRHYPNRAEQDDGRF